MAELNYVQTIFNHYFKMLLQKNGINDSDCIVEIESATKALVQKIQKLEERIEKLENK